MLTGDDPIPLRPRRIVVAGASGSGKTTLARRIAEVLDVEHTELDALFHGPNWTPRPDFMSDVEAMIAKDRWVTEWQYDAARPLLASVAELMVWLDPPYRQTLWRVSGRTIRRRVRRQELWNGNTEPSLWRAFLGKDEVVRWSIRSRHRLTTLVPEAARQHPELVVVRLRSQREVDRWVAGLPREA